ncbi:hypothetical protein ERJ75_000956300 [Trypanosoma vivax]|uniref:Uncharacterized protein n=1 Tax=Trypanosoma vivax (strain Y486) TaxID=1055687 RepID=G0U4R1_TRYVY|nr:hypothetical protein TRVL_01688 [Trypanosoma vivax]KAH8611678.1 hypothetical protein ERJ75_000956300 [Trypanosoma vivax]CCC52425.1 conserved hypothetical protein [Trypanosoma vivax Y486]
MYPKNKPLPPEAATRVAEVTSRSSGSINGGNAPPLKAPASANLASSTNNCGGHSECTTSSGKMDSQQSLRLAHCSSNRYRPGVAAPYPNAHVSGTPSNSSFATSASLSHGAMGLTAGVEQSTAPLLNYVRSVGPPPPYTAPPLAVSEGLEEHSVDCHRIPLCATNLHSTAMQPPSVWTGPDMAATALAQSPPPPPYVQPVNVGQAVRPALPPHGSMGCIEGNCSWAPPINTLSSANGVKGISGDLPPHWYRGLNACRSGGVNGVDAIPSCVLTTKKPRKKGAEEQNDAVVAYGESNSLLRQQYQHDIEFLIKLVVLLLQRVTPIESVAVSSTVENSCESSPTSEEIVCEGVGNRKQRVNGSAGADDKKRIEKMTLKSQLNTLHDVLETLRSGSAMEGTNYRMLLECILPLHKSFPLSTAIFGEEEGGNYLAIKQLSTISPENELLSRSIACEVKKLMRSIDFEVTRPLVMNVVVSSSDS